MRISGFLSKGCGDDGVKRYLLRRGLVSRYSLSLLRGGSWKDAVASGSHTGVASTTLPLTN